MLSYRMSLSGSVGAENWNTKNKGLTQNGICGVLMQIGIPARG